MNVIRPMCRVPQDGHIFACKQIFTLEHSQLIAFGGQKKAHSDNYAIKY